LSLLFHRTLGPILTASMTEYQMIEISNQQAHRDYPHMTLTPRVECATADQIYTSLSDFDAAVTANAATDQITFDARGRLLTAAHQPLPNAEVHYHLIYRLSRAKVEIVAGNDAEGPASALLRLRFILPVISQHDEAVHHVDAATVRLSKRGGNLLVHTDAVQGFESQNDQRTFNLVPGFECLPLAIVMQPGKEIRVELTAEPASK